MKNLRFFTLLLAVIVLGACEKQEQKSMQLDLQYVMPSYSPVSLTKGQVDITDNIGAFAFDLFNGLDRSKDLIISPYSLSMVLSMAVLGSNGDTKDEIIKTLGFDGKSEEELCDYYMMVASRMLSADSSVKFRSANSIWTTGVSLNDSFIGDCKRYFDADVKSNPSVEAINDWVSKKTEGAIPHFLEEVDPNAVFILLNAIYLKAPWAFKFQESSNNSISARLATSYMEKDNLVGIELPYGNGAFVMDLIMSSDGKNPASCKLDSDKWKGLLDCAATCDVTVKLPTFSFTGDVEMNDILQELGIKCAFDRLNADFSPMKEDYPLYISTVYQKSKIGVDLKGTEASAASMVALILGSAGEHSVPALRQVTFCPSNGFIFIIREVSTNAILLMGQYCQ